MNEIKIGDRVWDAFSGQLLGVVIAIYGPDANVVRVADDAVNCRNARDLGTFALAISK